MFKKEERDMFKEWAESWSPSNQPQQSAYGLLQGIYKTGGIEGVRNYFKSVLEDDRRTLTLLQAACIGFRYSEEYIRKPSRTMDFLEDTSYREAFACREALTAFVEDCGGPGDFLADIAAKHAKELAANKLPGYVVLHFLKSVCKECCYTKEEGHIFEFKDQSYARMHGQDNITTVRPIVE